jgi:hypothetical protein
MNFKTPFRFETEYKAIIIYAINNSIALPASGFTRQAQNRLMKNLKPSGLHTGSDSYRVFASDGAAKAFAMLDWKSPGTNTTTEHGTLTFSSEGFTGNGSTGYLDTHFNPATEGSNFTQNSGSLSIYVASYNGQSNAFIFGVRNAAGTAQIGATLRAIGVPDATRYIINDNTNTDYAANVMTKGMYAFERLGTTAKLVSRRTLSPSNGSVTSVAVPNGDIYLLARNSLSTATVDAFSSNTLAFWRIGDPLTSGEKLILAYAFTSYFRQIQLPEFFITTTQIDGISSRTVYTLTPAAWDSGSIFGFARYTGGGFDFEIYGGTTEDNDDPVGYSVGVFNFTTDLTGTKESGPLIDIGDYPTLESILPMDQLTIGSTIYWFFTVRLAGTITHDTYVATSTTADPKNIGTLTSLFTSGGAGHFWHGFRIVRDHPDTDYWYALISHRVTSSSAFTMDLYRCLRTDDITDIANWDLVEDDIIANPPNVDAAANVSPVYNYCYYDGSNYRLLYGRFFDAVRADSFTIYETKSSDLTTFPVGKECLWPTGNAVSDLDAQYTSTPFLKFIGSNYGYIYYSGRQGGGDAPYIARMVKQFYLRP